MKPAGFDSEKALHALRIYESYCRGESMEKSDGCLAFAGPRLFAGAVSLFAKSGALAEGRVGGF